MHSVYITCASRQEATKIAKLLLESKLIACANIFPVESMYLWKGKINNAKEYVILAKTLRNKFSSIQQIVKQNHSYEVPFIGIWKEKSAKSVKKWLHGEL